jgi:3',5'-cyclic-AMP phosphodiesterase
MFAWERTLLSMPIDSVRITAYDGPDIPEFGYRGTPAIRESLELLGRPLVIRGHTHLGKPLAELANGQQVLNVDAKVAVLRQDTEQEST